MSLSDPEPMLEELLAEPIIQLMMMRDNVVADDVRQIIHEARKRRACRHDVQPRDDLPQRASMLRPPAATRRKISWKQIKQNASLRFLADPSH